MDGKSQRLVHSQGLMKKTEQEVDQTVSLKINPSAPQKSTSSNQAIPPSGSTTSQCEPSVQTQDLMGDISQLNHDTHVSQTDMELACTSSQTHCNFLLPGRH